MARDPVLLTGATGTIGFKTLALLLEAGYQVRAAVRNQAGFDKILALKPIASYASQLDSIVVPDITAPGAYNDAVKGVKYIVHVASPLATSPPEDATYDTHVIQPAIRGTVGILESASKASGIQRIVITASVLSIASPVSAHEGDIVDEQTRTANAQGPIRDDMSAYAASKALSFQAAKRFIAENKPPFDVIHILPVFVLGRDDNVTEVQDIAKGSNGLLMGPLLGHALHAPLSGNSVHVDDVAKMHVLALDTKVKGNQDFLAASHPLEGIEWAAALDIVKKHYPKEYEAGVFSADSVSKLVTNRRKVDSTKAQNTFGIKFKTFEEQVVSVVNHFLELSAGNK
ncbi:hypothetical protein HIM_09029 [Hirsutella minnesotensis 3608]|uniref:NAD-dependent epimerase/dehydratase domain-containing protein n=1 Tax=Hirsutella minnesotensis 3608 TaxID=1043627 RepID=A0A0F7ZLY2_9HYPO|nr:hypothetical protein HIM_09029 [Hirsutella minnesotensis 3608]